MRKGDQDVMAGVYETCLPSHVPPLPEGVSGCFLPSHPPPDVTLFSVGFAPEHLGGAVLDRACVDRWMRGELGGAASAYTERGYFAAKVNIQVPSTNGTPQSRCFPTHLPAPPCCW